MRAATASRGWDNGSRMNHSGQILRANIYELVATRLMDYIASQELHPGEPIPTERELAEMYGVGRSSVREGLRMLESHGVVRPTGKAQFVVGDYGELLVPSLQMLVSLGQTDLAQVTSLRSVLEVEAAGLAAELRSDEDLEAMQRHSDAFEAALAGDAETVLEHDLAFHMAVVRASKNNALLAAAVGVRAAVERFLAGAFRPMEEAAPQHRAILKAIREGDSKKARAKMRLHMDWIVETLPPAGPAQSRDRVRTRGSLK
jgi:GntR family transcriptional repressor for pyruvate dehydrogenase complex